MKDKFADNRQINKMLRKIWSKLPSWHQKVTVTEYRINKAVEVELPFYKASSFHTSRKIFSTFLIASGKYTIDEISAMTGWKDQRMYKTYVNMFNNIKQKKKEIMF